MDKQPQNDSKSKQQALLMKTFSFGLEFGFIIALPLIALATLGKYLDGRFGTKLFGLLGMLLALTLSSAWIYKRLKTIKDQMIKQ